MKEIKLSTTFTLFEHTEELPEHINTLMNAAIGAREKAYAPYSEFKVGVALFIEGGEIITGNNQENASYPSGLCAERVAIYYAGAKFPGKTIQAIAISATALKNKTKEPVAPCGACRQAIAEYEIKQNSPIALYFSAGAGHIIKAESLKDLLPFIFEKSFLL